MSTGTEILFIFFGIAWAGALLLGLALLMLSRYIFRTPPPAPPTKAFHAHCVDSWILANWEDAEERWKKQMNAWNR